MCLFVCLLHITANAVAPFFAYNSQRCRRCEHFGKAGTTPPPAPAPSPKRNNHRGRRHGANASVRSQRLFAPSPANLCFARRTKACTVRATWRQLRGKLASSLPTQSSVKRSCVLFGAVFVGAAARNLLKASNARPIQLDRQRRDTRRRHPFPPERTPRSTPESPRFHCLVGKCRPASALNAKSATRERKPVSGGARP